MYGDTKMVKILQHLQPNQEETSGKKQQEKFFIGTVNTMVHSMVFGGGSLKKASCRFMQRGANKTSRDNV